MSSTESTRVVRNAKIPTGEIDGEIVALDIEEGTCFGLDEAGASIWRIAEQPVSVAEIIDGLTQEYEVDRQDCLRDILPFVDEMISVGLLRRVD